MKKALLILFGIAVAVSCSDDDNKETHEISGTWNLIDVTCECVPVDFEVGEHVWTFNTNESEVNVLNNPDENLQILDSGNYDFSLESTTITILGVAYDYYFEDEKLYLADQPEVDGPLLEFVRN